MSHEVGLEPLKPCNGCGACSAICKRGAITITENYDGSLTRVVDYGKCNNCRACNSVCYKFIEATEYPTLDDKTCYAVCSTNRATHSTTTSGGFGYELARWGVEHGYKIMGVEYDLATNSARSTVASTLEEIEKFKGSKYLQSYTEQAFKEIRDIATQNPEQRFICFGTPCQIFGLRMLIKRLKLSNEILYVDLFCHGVPSYLVWRPYIASQEQRLGILRNVNFRYKGNGWHHYSILIEGERKRYCNYAYNDIFYRYFFDNVALNRSCFDCEFRKGHSAADIRIGDFLGRAYESREDGISAVIPLSAEGMRAIDELRAAGSIDIVGRHSAKEALGAQSTEEYDNMELRNSVIRRLEHEDIESVQRWYFKQFPLKRRIYARLKSLATLLPVPLISGLRRCVRLKR